MASTETHSDPLIGPAALGERIGIPETTLAQWRYRGVGPRYIKIGRHVRYRVSDVEAWLEDQASAPPRAS